MSAPRHGRTASPVAVASRHRWTIAVWLAIGLWVELAFALVRFDYSHFGLAYYDLGNMIQAVWSTAHGHVLESTISTGEQAVRFGGHVDPILLLFVPLWLLAPTPLLLAGVQVVMVALGALPVYWLARRHLVSERAAALLAFSYLLYPWLAWSALDAFHPVTLAIPLSLYALWFLDGHRLRPFVVCALMIAATGELAGLAIAGMGLWYWLARSRPQAGAAIAAAGVAWTTTCLIVVIPAFSEAGTSPYGHHSSVGGSPGGILRTAVSDPGEIVGAVTSRADLTYVLWLAAPLLGLFALAPSIAAIGLPQLAVNTLADLPTATDPRHHYVAGIVPFLFAATAMGIGRLPASVRTLAAAAVLGASLVVAYARGPWPVPPDSRRVIHPRLDPAHVTALRRAVALVPASAPVSTTNTAGSQLAERRFVFTVPIVRHAEWIVLDRDDAYMGIAGVLPEGHHPRRLRTFEARIRADRAWSLVFEEDRVLVFRRVSRATGSEEP